MNANGSFTYTPNSSFSGTDSFAYRASDGSLASNVATVSITVNASTTDTVTIILAEYKKKTKLLTVQAKSSQQPNVTLTVAGYGDMTYNARRGYYSLTQTVSAAPASVTVTSNGGGSATRTVTVK